MQEEITRGHKIYLADSKNGKHVWYDGVSSHAATHIADSPGLGELASQIAGKTVLMDEYVQFHTDIGYPVGMTDMVNTEPGDEIVYAKRLNRDEYSVFNLTKSPQLSSFVTTVFERHDDDSYELVSAWIGLSDSPSFPGTERETSDSKVFWSTHALAWGRQEIQATTKTMICPW